jgi:valyl-tRNA synthetase
MKEKVLWPIIAKAREHATTHGEHLHQFDLDMFHDKLAELIVNECCDMFVELRTRPADLAVLDVKKHFGVA